MAIPNNLKAPDLFIHLLAILHGLIDHAVNVVSYSSDGTETERVVQQLLLEYADRIIKHIIKHPLPDLADVVVQIAVIRNQPIVIVQDSKHAAKTLRNNLFTGTKVLMLGNHPALYHDVHKLAFMADSPLYHRDIEKVNWQDDNATACLFSSAQLSHVIAHRPQLVGLIVYLFISAFIVLVYQNHNSLSILEHTKIALRTHFFIYLWTVYLDKAGYHPTAHYSLSHEALNILHILVTGFLGLVIIHRDHLDARYPFVPWLHSTKVCEHVFGQCRKLIKDFTYLDFSYMQPRLSLLVCSACKSAVRSDPRATAAGYVHSYYDPEKANLPLLSIFPSDADMDTAACHAWEEAANLWDLLGVSASDLLRFERATAGNSI